MKKLTVLLVFISVLLLFTNSWTQDFSDRFGVGLHASAVKMVLGKTDRSSIDQWAGLSLSYGFTNHWIMSLNGAYGWVYPRDPNGSQFSHAGVGLKTLLLPLYVSAEYITLPEKTFRPYFTFGGGILEWDIRNMAGTNSFIDRGKTVNGSTVNATLMIGVGLQQMIRDRLGLNLFVRYHQMFKGNEDTIGTGDDNRAVIEMGVEFKLWGVSNKDTDGDAIPDRWDLCPDEPEDYDGFKDEDGCPDLDNDNDGIPDLEDDCPDIPEDKDGFEDEDGCPDPDNDKDGIPDNKDLSPNEAEDFDGFEDEDGKPDLDNDQDGIPDDKDQCPNQAENFNGFEDEDGCPDEKPPIIEKGAKVILRGVNFETGSARLTSMSYTTLDTVFESLDKNPEIEIEVRGYTDSVGDYNFNLNLSQKRADVVKQYLVNRGLDSRKLRSVGYGEDDPIASNATAAGRAANRRIEFFRLK
jgi:outer membrane protein OmpA-like peptidoglycan-associated protein/outer membrane protein W